MATPAWGDRILNLFFLAQKDKFTTLARILRVLEVAKVFDIFEERRSSLIVFWLFSGGFLFIFYSSSFVGFLVLI